MQWIFVQIYYVHYEDKRTQADCKKGGVFLCDGIPRTEQPARYFRSGQEKDSRTGGGDEVYRNAGKKDRDTVRQSGY